VVAEIDTGRSEMLDLEGKKVNENTKKTRL
jgi:hypothetical protein